LDNFNALTLGDQVRSLAYGAVGAAHTSAHPRSWRRPTRASRDFVKWLAFGGDGVIAENDRAEQRKIIKYNHLLANCLIFHNVCTMTRALYKLRAEGLPIEPETVAALSPYIRAHISRFGQYTLDLSRTPAPIAYELPIFTNGMTVVAPSE
jgi:hypothetical protein